MWSAASQKPAENLRSDDIAPHNAPLRIIGTTDIDPVAGRIVVGSVSFEDNADAPRLKAQGDDFALELLAGFLE
jgi:hypothetical protein